MIRSTRDHFSKNFFSKLDFLKTVPVTIIATSEKNENGEISSLYMTFAFPLPVLNFLEISFPLYKKASETGRG